MKEKWFPPAECTESFEGKTVLITGANTGLGYEAAKKVAALNAERLIITTRSHSKGESTKAQIQEWLAASGSTTQTEILPLILDISTAEGVRSFVKQLALTTERLDSVMLNAGMNSPTCNISPDGFEETLQVNTISTVFLATLILPMMISTSNSTNTQTHLTFVSSRMATASSSLPSSQFQSSSTPLKDLAQASAFPQQAMGGQVRYGQSKLFLEYAIRRLNQLPAVNGNDGKPKVIINSVCPGICRTDIGRNYHNWFLLFFMHVIFMPLLSKSASDGANALLFALTAGEESRGQMWIVTRYQEKWDALKSSDGKAFGEKVWQELQTMMAEWEPNINAILQ